MVLEFTDVHLKPEELKPSQTKEKTFATAGIQSDPLQKRDIPIQSVTRAETETQTDVVTVVDVKFIEDNSPALVEFIKRVTPFICKQLDKNVRSHAFDGYEVNWGEAPLASQSIFSLSYAAICNVFQVTSVSWSSTGSVLAVSYGKHDHEHWCTDPAYLCTWNIDRRQIDTQKPDTIVEVDCCLMMIKFHPKQPNIIVGGTFNGEICVWDLSKEDDVQVASSGMVDTHREPVSKINWIPDEKTIHSGKLIYNVITCSGDGKILVWKVPQRGEKSLELIKGFCILAESLPRTMRSLKTKRDAEIGVTDLSFVHDDPMTFIVATEPGCLFQCNMEFKGTPAPTVLHQGKVTIHSPVTFTYQPHNGTVYSVQCSPFHRKLFMSVATDMSVHLYNMLETKPILCIEPNAGYLYAAQWSPFRPLVFAVTSATGTLLVYDLKESRISPVHKLETNQSRAPIFTIQFNPEQRRLLSVGDGEGVAQVFQLSDELTSPAPGEDELLVAITDDISAE